MKKIIILILVLVIILALGFFTSNFNSNPTVDTIPDQPTYIETSLEETITTESNDTFSIKTPKLLINSADADTINTEIKKLEDEYTKALDDIYSTEYRDINYSYYLNENVLSLVITKKYYSDYIDYEVYNINIETNSLLSNTDLLNIKNISEDEYTIKLKAVTDSLHVTIDDIPNPDSATQNTIQMGIQQANLLNIPENIQLFYNENSNLSAIASVFTYAGGGFMYKLIDIEKGTEFLIQ